uniref:Uncharacterized protein n=2 Tax=Arundo donax TaxID=35708 RepID=A0A0A9EV73_ARUDO
MPGRTNTDSTPLTLKSFSGLFLTSGSISFVMLLISIVRLVHARWTYARSATAQSTSNSVGDEESRPLQNGTGNFSVLDQPQPEARNDDYQATHGTNGSVAVEECHPIQNNIGHSSVSDQRLNEVISNDSQGAHRSSGTVGFEEPSAVHTGFVPAQSFQIEMNTGRNVGAILHGPS